MRIFFDVDFTLIAPDGSLRPLVHEVFQRIVNDGHEIYVWSGAGIRWEVIRRHGLRPYIKDCFVKPLSDYRDSFGYLGVHKEPEFCVDDYPEVIEALGGTAIRPYLEPNPADEEMLRVYDAICAVTATRVSC